jgi:uncharacterized protein (UPF0332 family)
MSDRPQKSIQRARQALRTARRNHEEGNERAALNRLYYACFHAARGVLYDKGFDPKTHGGVLTLFGETVVQTNEAPKTDGRLFRKVQDLRDQADYQLQPVSADIEQLAHDTENFVGRMAELLDESDENVDT